MLKNLNISISCYIYLTNEIQKLPSRKPELKAIRQIFIEKAYYNLKIFLL